MEAYASAALVGAGYAFNQNQDPHANIMSNKLNNSDVPSMKSLYDSKHWDKVRQEEFGLSTNMWNQAQTPMETGVIPKPAYADMFVPITPQFNNSGATINQKQQPIKSLTGDVISPENFKHNNMQPFYRGDVKQNIEPFASSSYLENSTGRGERFKHKQEVEQFFAPTPGLGGNVYGMENNDEFYRGRVVDSRNRNNTFPIPQQTVGPGLNKGYTTKGSGGFQQNNTLDYAKPRNVDELRPLTRPKVTYQIPFQGPKGSKIQNRGLEGEMFKNRPDTYYEQTKDQWIHTKAPAVPGQGENDDYGKSSVLVYDNERDITQQRTVLNNVTSMVKSVVAPFFDILKRSTKEYLVDSARVYGNMSAQIPEKPTLYDPVNHIMKTTIKETTVHDTTLLNPKGNDKGWVEGDDEAKTTVRETIEQFDTVRNVGSHVYKTVVIDPDMVAKNTHRQTMTVNINQQGYAGNGNQYYPRSYDAEYNAEIDGTREMLNIKSGNTPNAKGANVGIDVNDVDMQSKKLDSDRVNNGGDNISKIYQPTMNTTEQGETTKEPLKPFKDPVEDRLDPGLLSVLKENPYNHTINPLV